jgi:hypothetical protein
VSFGKSSRPVLRLHQGYVDTYAKLRIQVVSDVGEVLDLSFFKSVQAFSVV